tara:strand:- start:905 stop:1441 length:537 start_codon:yes stop_codon:yes gene_type:complete
MSKGFELNPIEKNIPISKPKGNYKTTKTLAIEERLLSMTPQEDSFIVEDESDANGIRLIGKRIGRPIISRKTYIQGDIKNQRLSDLKPVYRIWVKEITEPQKGYSQPNYLHKNAKPKNSSVDKYSVPQSILQIAELKAENKMIVEDMQKIKKIIIEELGTKNEFKYPLRTNEDQGDLG